MKIIACTCNQPQRLPAALVPVRAALIAQPPISRWGLGYIQGGDVLLVRTPRASTAPVDLLGPLATLATDCAIAQAVLDERGTPLGGTDNTPPFRFRRWLFAGTESLALQPALDELVASGRLLAHIPEVLRRNIRGRSPSEQVFHVFLAALSDVTQLDDPNLSTEVTRKALAQTLRLVATELAALGGAGSTGAAAGATAALGTIALSNGRSMVVARTGEEPLRLRRLVVTGGEERGDERGVNAFRGYILVSGTDALGEGFEEIAPNHAVLISRDLKVTLASLA